MANYADYTYNSKNRLQRFSHRKRFKNSVNLFNDTENARLLDYGCGDGFFLNQLVNFNFEKISLVGYEPVLEPEMNDKINIMKNWEDVLENVVNDGKFDYITCFEVLEHFSIKKQMEIIENINRVLVDDGLFIVSVPIEKGISSLVKNLIRKRNAGRLKPVYSFRNMIKSVFSKPIAELRKGDEYIYHHVGFYFNDLETVFSKYFTLVKKQYSPFKRMGYNFNSQVFYQLKKNRVGECSTVQPKAIIFGNNASPLF